KEERRKEKKVKSMKKFQNRCRVLAERRVYGQGSELRVSMRISLPVVV
ncbi:jg1837, partial [Pararge aegeria aegeria]